MSKNGNLIYEDEIFEKEGMIETNVMAREIFGPEFLPYRQEKQM